MVKLSKITRGLNSDIFVKLEYLNPTGSLKDRIALRMVEQAEKEGVLRPGRTIVESSTGNTGTSLSFVGTMKGYKVVIFETTPGKMGEEKMKIMRNFGAEVRRITPKEMEDLRERSVAGAEIELPGRRICLDLEKARSDVWWARQFSNPQNVKAHNETAREIVSQIDGKIDAFTASIGTGGTLMGIAEVLKKEFPHIMIVGIQPASSRRCFHRVNWNRWNTDGYRGSVEERISSHHDCWNTASKLQNQDDSRHVIPEKRDRRRNSL